MLRVEKGNLCGFVATSQENFDANIGAHHETEQLENFHVTNWTMLTGDDSDCGSARLCFTCLGVAGSGRTEDSLP